MAPGSDAEAYAVALIRCDGGNVISLEKGECMSAPRDHAWHIIGAEGSLSLTMPPGEAKRTVRHDTCSERGTFSRVIWQGDEDWLTAHLGPVVDFVCATRELH